MLRCAENRYIMEDHVSVYWSLFQGAFPEEWKSEPEFTRYMSDLTSYSIEKLQIEPEVLREEKRFVLNSTQKLAFNNYQAFIGTADCTREIFKDFVAVEDHVNKLLEKIPGFSDACKKFAVESHEVNTKRKLNSLALSRHTQLLEVLEIPQVMETCVRNGYYEEALDLSTHVKRMGKKHGDISIIKAICKDVETSMDLMLHQLLQQLRGSIQLPTCLRVVGFLRRMEVFSDIELHLKFLQTRDSWLQGILGAIPRDDPYNHINKTIEASRVHLFDVITQYQATFPGDDPVKPRGDKVERALFYCWVNEKIWQFLHVLEDDLSRGVGDRLDSLLGQCMYFGLSFGRIGVDFRSLVVPVFVRALLNSFRITLRNSKHEFHEGMKRLVLTSPLRSLSIPPTSSLSSLNPSSPHPPHSLLDYPPLALLTNALIQAINDLRQCAPLAGGPIISQELRRLLESTVHDIGEYYRVEHEAFTDKDKEAFRQLVRVVIQDFLPFTKRIFENLYSRENVEQLALSTPYAINHRLAPTSTMVLGHTSYMVDLKMELNIREIGEPLRSLAPDVFEEMEASGNLHLTRQEQELPKEDEDVSGLGEVGEDMAEGSGMESETEGKLMDSKQSDEHSLEFGDAGSSKELNREGIDDGVEETLPVNAKSDETTVRDWKSTNLALNKED